MSAAAGFFRQIDDDRIAVRLAPGPGRHRRDIEADIAAHMAEGIAKTRAHLAAGRPGRALYELTRSLQAQAKVAGLGLLEIPDVPAVREAAR